jgi:hypothetical protein
MRSVGSWVVLAAAWGVLLVEGCVGPVRTVGENSGTGGGAPLVGGDPGGEPSTDDTASPGRSVNRYVSLLRLTDDGSSHCFGPGGRDLPVESTGQPSCRLFASDPEPQSGCDCGALGRANVDRATADAVMSFLGANGACGTADDQRDISPKCSDLCLCEVPRATGPSLDACLDEVEPPAETEGWCYVSPHQGVGSAAVVASCEDKRMLRYFGAGRPQVDETMVLACAEAVEGVGTAPVVAAPLGEACVPAEEYDQGFDGFQYSEVNLDTENPGCASRTCVVNHFQGRVSCPYGQLAGDLAEGAPLCFVPGTNLGVTVPVDSQRVTRRAADAVVCSCRCDGPGPGPFCSCPGSMECAPLIQNLGLPDDATLAGSYCIPRGTAYDVNAPSSPETCLSTSRDSGSPTCGDPRPY